MFEYYSSLPTFSDPRFQLATPAAAAPLVYRAYVLCNDKLLEIATGWAYTLCLSLCPFTHYTEVDNKAMEKRAFYPFFEKGEIWLLFIRRRSRYLYPNYRHLETPFPSSPKLLIRPKPLRDCLKGC